jgi:hypothetical protein
MTVARRDFSGQGVNCMLATQNETRYCALPIRGEAEVYLTTFSGEPIVLIADLSIWLRFCY